MPLAQVFKISLYCLTGIASIALILGDEYPLLACLSIPIAIAAYLLSEHWTIVRLSGSKSSVVGVLALLLAAAEFAWVTVKGDELIFQLLAGSHLLLYLTWIVMFQEKQTLQYWLLLALGLLQVAVGAVLTISPWFGVLLLTYMSLAVWTVSIFTLYQGELKFAGMQRIGLLPVTGGMTRSVVRNSVQLDPDERWLSPRFVIGIFSITVVGLSLGFGFFLFVPRFWQGGLNFLARDASSSLVSGRTLTGFSEKVQLGDMGRILENPEPVLTVNLSLNNKMVDSLSHKRSDQSRKPLTLDEFVDGNDVPGPLFRGTVFDSYERDLANRAQWRSELRSIGGRTREPIDPVPPNTKSNVVRQEYVLQPIGASVLFALFPIDGGKMTLADGTISVDTPRIFQVTSSGVFVAETAKSGEIYYTLFSSIHEDRRPSLNVSPILREAEKRYLQLPPHGLERMTDLARKVAEGTVVPSATPPAQPPVERTSRQKVDALVAYLRDSGIFDYTLDASVQDTGIDPVEDFLFNRKKGHCEYYASALTLMLRAVGVPARMVGGFKGAVRGTKDGEYIVQQRHAHAWVEAHVDGRWISLDPTPAARDESVASMEVEQSLWKDLKQELASFWSVYVVGLNIERQQRAFFGPATARFIEVWMWVGQFPRKFAPEWFSLLISHPELWFTWRGGLTAVGLAACCSILILFVHWFSVMANAVRRKLKTGQGSQIHVEFYERFLRVLAAEGLLKSDADTPRDFALRATTALQLRMAAAGLEGLPTDLTDHFYRIRFGGERIEPADSTRLGQQIDLLERTLRSGGN